MLKPWRECRVGIPKLPQLQSGPTSPTMRPQGWGGHSCPQSLVKSVNTQSGVSCLAPDSVFRKPSPAAGPGRWLLASSSALSPAGPSQADLAPMHCPRQTPHAKPGAYKQRNRVTNRLAWAPVHTVTSQDTKLECLQLTSLAFCRVVDESFVHDGFHFHEPGLESHFCSAPKITISQLACTC